MVNRVNNRFLKDSHFISDLKLCSIRLIDNAKFPWIILIPKRKNITDISELITKDQMLLMKEIVYCSKLMKKIFKTKKLNIEKALITCDKDNIASSKTILNNNGILDKEYMHEGVSKQRYWINVA